jgi:hypothetical protein
VHIAQLCWLGDPDGKSIASQYARGLLSNGPTPAWISLRMQRHSSTATSAGQGPQHCLLQAEVVLDGLLELGVADDTGREARRPAVEIVKRC